MAKVIELWSQEGRQMRKATKVLDDYCFKMIDDRLKRNAELSAAGEAPEHKVDDLGKDILDLFMEKGADREELRTCIINFLIAGRDTVSMLKSKLADSALKPSQSISPPLLSSRLLKPYHGASTSSS